jgi:hypothetical protein
MPHVFTPSTNTKTVYFMQKATNQNTVLTKLAKFTNLQIQLSRELENRKSYMLALFFCWFV